MVSINSNNLPLKFLCSYGGKILPRHPDGKLRYYGGETRVLSVDRCISFAELLVKLGEMYGSSVNLRCQLPAEDLDALVSITSDEDLANLMEEYDRASSPPSSVKIRAFLSPPKSIKKHVSPPPSTASASASVSASASTSSSSTATTTSPKSSFSSTAASPASPSSSSTVTWSRCVIGQTRPPVVPLCYDKASGRTTPRYCHSGNGHIYLVHHGSNHWQ